MNAQRERGPKGRWGKYS